MYIVHTSLATLTQAQLVGGSLVQLGHRAKIGQQLAVTCSGGGGCRYGRGGK